MSFFKNLLSEVAKNGKTALGVLLMQLPLTSFPGVTTAARTAITDRTPASYIDLAVQVLLIAGAAARTGKVVITAADKTK